MFDAGEDIYSEAIAPHTKACTLERVDEAFHGCHCFCLSALGKTVFENAFNYSLFYFFFYHCTSDQIVMHDVRKQRIDWKQHQCRCITPVMSN